MKYWLETISIARRILIELLRRKQSLIFWVVFPIAVLLLNALIMQERAKAVLPDGLTFAQSIERAAPATLVGAAFFFSCLGGTVAIIVSEREHRTFKRLFLSPLSGLSYFLGIGLAQGAIALGQTLMMIALSACLGAGFHGSPWLGGLVLLLSILGYVGVGFILGAYFARRTEDVNTLVATFGVPLLLLGGAFVPAFIFPKLLLNLAQYNPIYHMTEALIGLTVNIEGAPTVTKHLWFLSIFAAAMLLAGWLSYQQMIRIERRL